MWDILNSSYDKRECKETRTTQNDSVVVSDDQIIGISSICSVGFFSPEKYHYDKWLYAHFIDAEALSCRNSQVSLP